MIRTHDPHAWHAHLPYACSAHSPRAWCTPLVGLPHVRCAHWPPVWLTTPPHARLSCGTSHTNFGYAMRKLRAVHHVLFSLKWMAWCAGAQLDHGYNFPKRGGKHTCVGNFGKRFSFTCLSPPLSAPRFPHRKVKCLHLCLRRLPPQL
jgi:hypothetical protein